MVDMNAFPCVLQQLPFTSSLRFVGLETTGRRRLPFTLSLRAKA